MFDLGWQELFVIGTVTLIVVGPKDLPKLLNKVGKILGKVKQVAREFYDQINETAEMEEINDLKKAVKLGQKKVILEASGKIDYSNVEKIAATGVNFISSGWITHSSKSLDIGLDLIKN